MATIEIPTLLRQFTNQKKQLEVDGQLLMDVILNLINQHPELKQYLLNEQGDLNPFINIYLNGRDARYLNKDTSFVGSNDIITIVPAIAGG